MRVLTIGATGQYAGLVVPALVSKGLSVRALVHDPGKAGQLADAGVDETVAGDLRDPDGMRAALDGVEGVFLIIPAFAPDTAELGTALVMAAQAAGVRRVVFSGVYHPSLSLVNHASTARSRNRCFTPVSSSPCCSRRCSCKAWPAGGCPRPTEGSSRCPTQRIHR